MQNKKRKRQRGQALVEYVLIIVVVVIAAFALLAAFSDRVRTMLAGATNELGGSATVDQSSKDLVVNFGEDGVNSN